jgi:hypothetical protein
MNEQALLQSIFILESRINSVTKEEMYGNAEEKANLELVFPLSAQCLYFYLIGESYFQLFSLSQKNDEKTKKWSDKAIENLENGMRLVSQVLEPHEGR